MTRREIREAERRAQEQAAANASAPGVAPQPATRRAPSAQSVQQPRSAQPRATVDTAARVPSWTSGAAITAGRTPQPAAPAQQHHNTVRQVVDHPARAPRPQEQPPRGTAQGHTVRAGGVTAPLDARAAMPVRETPVRETPVRETPLQDALVRDTSAPTAATAPAAERPMTAFQAARYVPSHAGQAAPSTAAPAGMVPGQVGGSWLSDIRPVDKRLSEPETPRADVEASHEPATIALPALTEHDEAPALAADEQFAPAPEQAAPSGVREPAAAGVIEAAQSAPAPAREVAAARTRRAPRASSHPIPAHPGRRPGRAAMRLGVLAALAGVTVVIPVSQGAIAGAEVLSGEPLTNATLPSTVSALTAAPASLLPPASLMPVDGGVPVRALAAAASRSEVRSPLPGCNPNAGHEGASNGLLPETFLCTLWDSHTQLRADAASSLAEFNAAYVARFGADMCLVSGYRTLAQQRSVKASRGSFAATPGKSNHGWGLAVDFCGTLTSGERWDWLNENAKAFGWENPSWARPGGSGPYERWHWEYLKGVKADGEYYG
ncbi:D-alanyl-D-alanine carboxypeptidase family protein [Cellulomonas edaphi]|uniref:D-alanyl-D-alanine carboxypeptidase family protein n=1 Tax=Cellulomonas edaphi TaxID=3053468 RepID=A0ABT7SA16_9CELL|nr:D-alanyl-D-alanine carboxypeptidase family protein [Cellulomons edaphi]MDM7832463.1 D-alanyl-D-alanine carboxypeptidase family protein [Cellulomons edaphi]